MYVSRNHVRVQIQSPAQRGAGACRVTEFQSPVLPPESALRSSDRRPEGAYRWSGFELALVRKAPCRLQRGLVAISGSFRVRESSMPLNERDL